MTRSTRFPSFCALLAGSLALAACADSRTPLAPTANAWLSVSGPLHGSYVVRFSGGVPQGFAARVASLGGTVTFAHGPAGLAAVDGLSAGAAQALGRLAGVAAVVPDDATQLEGGEVETEAMEVPAGVESAADPAAALGFSRQWNMRAIHAPQAWAAGRVGSPAVRVAILDSGIGYTHPDLAGLVDLAASRSFVPAEDARVASLFPGAHPVADLHNHGTHVASTIASNGLLTAGVASRVTLVGVKVCDASGACPMSTMLAGLLYAADQGVHVANISAGGAFMRRDSVGGGGRPAVAALINQAFIYAHRRGVTVVVSAGNEGMDLDGAGNLYKAYCDAPTAICVSATGPTAAPANDGPFTDPDAKAPYSNFGRSAVSVAAPGGAGRSAAPVNRGWVWASCSMFSVRTPACQRGPNITGMNGTSMAAPHVAGLAALIASEGITDPAHVRARLQQSADDLGQPGTDPVYGKGRINVARATGVI